MSPDVRSSRPARRLLPRLALALATLVLADLLAGLLLIPEEVVAFRRPDPWYHHGLVAGASGTTRWGSGEPYAFATNSLACVDRQAREVPLSSERRRVLLLGDSFTEGIGVPFAQSFAGLLEERLAPAGLEVLNAGVVSFSPHLYRLRLEHLLRQVGLRVDELVVLIDMSDIQDEVLYRHFEPRVPGALERATAGLHRLLQRRSFALHFLERHLAARRREAKRVLYGLTDSPPWLDYFWLDDIDTEPMADPTFRRVRLDWDDDDMLDNRWAKLGVELAVANMDGVADLCREFGIGLTLAVYPWPPQIAKGELAPRQVGLWREFCERRGARFVDLFPTFVAPADSTGEAVREREFLTGDVHWNALGHERVADALEPILRAVR
jgi:lysophospholipase L1-like esterase